MSTALPETIGSFRIISKLGQGGMGTVYRAMHGTLERPVALKILPAEFSSNPEYVTRFLREARTVAGMRHENVVQVYDAGEQNGRYFIAMELVDGCNLMQYIEKKKTISEDEGLGLLLQAARGLAAAHAKGLVHRDIKPENLLMGDDQILRIVDFGLVMESSSTTQLTATGACLGTPMYMSPEQADGEQADLRTDIYSLGVTFYRVFTGQPPFTSPTVMNLLFKHKFEVVPDPKSIRPDLSNNVRNLLLQMMSKGREDRPPNALALVELIEGIKVGKAILAPPEFVPLPGMTRTVSATMIRPEQAEQPVVSPMKLWAAGAAVVVIGVIAFLLTRGGNTPEAATATAASGAGSSELIKRGDQAFADGRDGEAIENYRQAQANAPTDEMLKAKISAADRRQRFAESMRQGESFEAKGELESAAARYTDATASDDSTRARESLARVQSRLADRKAGGVLATNAANRNDAERDQHIKRATHAEKIGDFEIACEQYQKAAALSDNPERGVFHDKANECRRQQYLTRAMAAENKQDYIEAENQYRLAQAIKSDALVSQKLESVQKKQRETNGLVPADGTRARELEARELMARGDGLRAGGNTVLAAKAYNDATQRWPALAPEIAERTKTLAPAVPRPFTAPPAAVIAANPAPVALLRRVDDLVRSERDDAALNEIESALRNTPTDASLKGLKTAFQNLQTGASIYNSMQANIAAVVSRIKDVQDIEDDERLRTFRETFKKMSAENADKARRARTQFLVHDYASVGGTPAAAQTDAGQAADEIGAVADFCDRRGEKAGRVNVNLGPLKIDSGAIGGRREKFKVHGEKFRQLAEQTRVLSK